MASFALLMLLAQGDVLPASPAGWAGWASFLTSGGVLAWLLFIHLPAKDKQAKEKDEQILGLIRMQTEERVQEREARHQVATRFQEALGESVEKLTQEFNRSMKEARDDFKQTLGVIMAQHDRHVTDLAQAIRREFEKIK